MLRKFILALIPAIALLAVGCGDDDNGTVLSDFDELTLQSESHYTPDATGLTQWTSGDAQYALYFDQPGGDDFWEGITYTNESDTTTAGYENQYSAITGAAHSGDIYAVAYTAAFNQAAEVTFPDGAQTLEALWVTNTTYAYLSLRDGSAYSKKFGGTDGTDPDWFKLTIHGLDANGESTGTVEFYLADYRADDAGDDYIVQDWTRVDLSPLGAVNGLRFELSSSDVGDWGMNTPAYFAFDDLTAE